MLDMFSLDAQSSEHQNLFLWQTQWAALQSGRSYADAIRAIDAEATHYHVRKQQPTSSAGTSTEGSSSTAASSDASASVAKSSSNSEARRSLWASLRAEGAASLAQAEAHVAMECEGRDATVTDQTGAVWRVHMCTETEPGIGGNSSTAADSCPRRRNWVGHAADDEDYEEEEDEEEDEGDDGAWWHDAPIVSECIAQYDLPIDVCVGHVNKRTVKEACFYGSAGRFVVSGDDGGCVFVYDRAQRSNGGKLLPSLLLRGDASIVNCCQAHPDLDSLLLATSGIDHTVKLWSPGDFRLASRRSARDSDEPTGFEALNISGPAAMATTMAQLLQKDPLPPPLSQSSETAPRTRRRAAAESATAASAGTDTGSGTDIRFAPFSKSVYGKARLEIPDGCGISAEQPSGGRAAQSSSSSSVSIAQLRSIARDVPVGIGIGPRMARVLAACNVRAMAKNGQPVLAGGFTTDSEEEDSDDEEEDDENDDEDEDDEDEDEDESDDDAPTDAAAAHEQLLRRRFIFAMYTMLRNRNRMQQLQRR
jgi:hypothetical protein